MPWFIFVYRSVEAAAEARPLTSSGLAATQQLVVGGHFVYHFGAPVGARLSEASCHARGYHRPGALSDLRS